MAKNKPKEEYEPIYIDVKPVLKYLNGWLEHFDSICVDSRGKKLPVFRRNIVLAIKNFVENQKQYKADDIVFNFKYDDKFLAAEDIKEIFNEVTKE